MVKMLFFSEHIFFLFIYIYIFIYAKGIYMYLNIYLNLFKIIFHRGVILSQGKL